MSWFLWGILTVQIYYYSTFFKDSWRLRTLVYGLYVVDSLQVFVNMQSAFDLLCNNWGNAEKILVPGWTFCIMPVFSGLVSYPVQCFFAFRIWKLRTTWKAPLAQLALKFVIAFVLLCGLAQALGAMITGGRLAEIGDTRLISVLNAYIALWLGGSTVCDTVITITLLLLLRSAGKTTEWKKTKNLIDSLIQQTVQTGMITTIAASVELILFLVLNKTYLHTILACILGKLYTNSLMATLNSRAWKRTNKGSMLTTTDVENISINKFSRNGLDSNTSGQVLVRVDHIHQVHSDTDSATKMESHFND